MVLEEIKPRNDYIVYLVIVYIHIWPALAVFLNVILSKTLFIYSHYRYLTVVGIIYMIANFIGTKISGKPLYPFMPWTDISTLFVAIGLLLMGLVLYFTVCFLVNKSKIDRSKQ